MMKEPHSTKRCRAALRRTKRPQPSGNATARRRKTRADSARALGSFPPLAINGMGLQIALDKRNSAQEIRKGDVHDRSSKTAFPRRPCRLDPALGAAQGGAR